MVSDPASPTAVGESLTQDPLSEESRKNRRMLLGVSTLGLAVSVMDMVPTRIEAFGIELSEAGGYFPLLLSGVTVYFAIAFLLSAFPDYLRWLGNHAWVQYRTVDAALRALEGLAQDAKASAGKGASTTPLTTTLRRLRWWSNRVAFARFAFDAVLPFILAGLSIWCLSKPPAAPEVPIPPTSPLVNQF